MNILIAAIVICFIGLSRQIQAASGVKPKPMTKKERWTLYAIVLFIVRVNVVVGICAMIADGSLDFLGTQNDLKRKRFNLATTKDGCLFHMKIVKRMLTKINIFKYFQIIYNFSPMAGKYILSNVNCGFLGFLFYPTASTFDVV